MKNVNSKPPSNPIETELAILSVIIFLSVRKGKIRKCNTIIMNNNRPIVMHFLVIELRVVLLKDW